MDGYQIQEALQDVEYFEYVIRRSYEETLEESIIGVIDDDDWFAVDKLDDGRYHLEIQSSKVKNEGFAEEDELEGEIEKKLDIIEDVF